MFKRTPAEEGLGRFHLGDPETGLITLSIISRSEWRFDCVFAHMLTHTNKNYGNRIYIILAF